MLSVNKWVSKFLAQKKILWRFYACKNLATYLFSNNKCLAKIWAKLVTFTSPKWKSYMESPIELYNLHTLIFSNQKYSESRNRILWFKSFPCNFKIHFHNKQIRNGAHYDYVHTTIILRIDNVNFWQHKLYFYPCKWKT